MIVSHEWAGIIRDIGRAGTLESVTAERCIPNTPQVTFNPTRPPAPPDRRYPPPASSPPAPILYGLAVWIALLEDDEPGSTGCFAGTLVPIDDIWTGAVPFCFSDYGGAILPGTQWGARGCVPGDYMTVAIAIRYIDGVAEFHVTHTNYTQGWSSSTILPPYVIGPGQVLPLTAAAWGVGLPSLLYSPGSTSRYPQIRPVRNLPRYGQVIFKNAQAFAVSEAAPSPTGGGGGHSPILPDGGSSRVTMQEQGKTVSDAQILTPGLVRCVYRGPSRAKLEIDKV